MSHRPSTVGQLIEALKQFPQDAKISVTGADCGGYDVTWLPEVDLHLESGDEFLEPNPILHLSGAFGDEENDWWDIKRINECKRDGHRWENSHQSAVFMTRDCRFLTRCHHCNSIDESLPIYYRLKGKPVTKEQYDIFQGEKYDH